MKSSILVSRIMRVIETDGLIGEGANLARDFDEAVKVVNSRLEAVQAAVASQQVSDAVRLMEDAPRLVDEINALDFNRLAEWDALCERNGWQRPMPIDRTLLEKTLLLSESTEVAEPFLRMYRKAVRTNNNALAVKALRRLVEIDHSQNWEDNLIQAEGTLQRSLLEDFTAARNAGNSEEVDRIARDVLETAWRKAPAGKGVAEVKQYWDAKESRRREAEGAEDISLLRKCRDENWNRGLACSMLRAIDVLVDNGWKVPDGDSDMVEECRRRVADEIEAEEKERRWKACCETLHGAIQREDTTAIREALSAPEFLDHEPPEDLIRDAQGVIEHENVAKRRKVTKISVCSLLALLAILSVSGWWLRQKLFNIRCEGESVKLTALAKESHAIDRMSEALRKLEVDDPEVYADPRVNVFSGKLKSMIAANCARTNELTGVLAALSEARDANWAGGPDSVTGHLARAESLINADDTDYRPSLQKLKAAYADHVAKAEDALREKASKRHETLMARIQDVATQLKEIVGADPQDKMLTVCKSDISEWHEAYAAVQPTMDGKLVESEKVLAEAEQMQKNVRDAIAKLRAATEAPDILEARKTLIDFYSGYACIKRLAPNPVDTAVVREVMNGNSIAQKEFLAAVTIGIPADKFKTFLEENVLSLSEIPSFYALYGLVLEGDYSGKFFAFSKGKPEFKRPSYSKSWQISGELLDVVGRRMTDKLEKNAQNIQGVVIPSVDEIRSCVDTASRTNLTVSQFEEFVLKLIDEHLKVVHKTSYIGNEMKVADVGTFIRDRYTAWRRVIMLDLYFRWLNEDLKVMPPDEELMRSVEKADALAQSIRVEGVPEDLSWVCLWEKRVRDRNVECLQMLKKIPADWVTQYRKWRSVRAALRDIARWKVESAGQLLLDPCNSYQKADPDAVIPLVPASVKKDHPLYVIRESEEKKLMFVNALVPWKDGWGIASESIAAGVKLMPGEPLYQICRDGAAIDAKKELEKIISEFPPRIARALVAKIPFFKMEVK